MLLGFLGAYALLASFLTWFKDWSTSRFVAQTWLSLFTVVSIFILSMLLESFLQIYKKDKKGRSFPLLALGILTAVHAALLWTPFWVAGAHFMLFSLWLPVMAAFGGINLIQVFTNRKKHA